MSRIRVLLVDDQAVASSRNTWFDGAGHGLWLRRHGLDTASTPRLVTARRHHRLAKARGRPG